MLTIDHRIPLIANGPAFDRLNLDVLCRRCNSRTGARASPLKG
ncbi:MAG: HNH endonuclease [Chloroflexota bacterium]|nr:HNH endonuclease [Chloroflexota bacterium]